MNCPFCGDEVQEETEDGELFFKCTTSEMIDEHDNQEYERGITCYENQLAQLKDRIERMVSLLETCAHELSMIDDPNETLGDLKESICQEISLENEL